jgi:sulfate transport system permease protein
MTLLWLSLIVLIPLAALFLKTTELSLEQFVRIVTSPRVVHALQLSFGLSLAAAAVNLLFGSAVVWALVRYEFPGRRLFDAIVDIPIRAADRRRGIALTNLYAENGWLGPAARSARHPGRLHAARHLRRAGLRRPSIRGANRAAGTGDLEAELEEAAATLGASRLTTIRRVIFPPSCRRYSRDSRSPSPAR